MRHIHIVCLKIRSIPFSNAVRPKFQTKKMERRKLPFANFESFAISKMCAPTNPAPSALWENSKDQSQKSKFICFDNIK